MKKSSVLLGALIYMVGSSVYSGVDRSAEVCILVVGVFVLVHLEGMRG